MYMCADHSPIWSCHGGVVYVCTCVLTTHPSGVVMEEFEKRRCELVVTSPQVTADGDVTEHISTRLPHTPHLILAHGQVQGELGGGEGRRKWGEEEGRGGGSGARRGGGEGVGRSGERVEE